MFARLAEASTSLDIGTLFVTAGCVTALLGLFLLFAWVQERMAALAWWGSAYLIGGFSAALWRSENVLPVPVPAGVADVLLFIALGMIWTAARAFHGRDVRLGAMCSGAVVWTAADVSHAMPHTPAVRIMLGSVIVAIYTFMIAAELWRERRKSLIRRWPSLLVPMLHGAIFLFPVALASLGVRSLATGWVAVFAIEVTLYVVGAAFIVLVLAKDRTVSRYKRAAETDPLTGLLNRRGFFAAASVLMTANRRKKLAPVSVLAFDLDKFKSINDRFGHKMGDVVLEMFSKSVQKTMRADDIIGRLGGEEFVAIISGKLPDARIAAERVRVAFEAAALAPDSPQIPVTVSIGVASGLPTANIDEIIERADAVLYRAKESGRNRVEADEELVVPQAHADGARKPTEHAPAAAKAGPVPAVVTVPIMVR
ncbi:MAG: GGDEF domain-containing protein [Xanthobacteraceae bacterium]